MGETRETTYLRDLDHFATMLFANWQACMECQYNTYVCKQHMPLVEPILQLVGEMLGVVVEDFQVQEYGPIPV